MGSREFLFSGKKMGKITAWVHLDENHLMMKEENLMIKGERGALLERFPSMARRVESRKVGGGTGEVSHRKKHRDLSSSMEQLWTVSSFPLSWCLAKHLILGFTDQFRKETVCLHTPQDLTPLHFP